MRAATSGFALLVSVLAATVGAAQPRARVDFARDVKPIFEAHCYACHGPEQQMNAFRLDRRSDALRGGTQTNIGPFNADGSRLYHRLVGTHFGPRMPPSGPLADAQIETIREWIDEGADWPDAVSGEPPALASDADATRLNAAIRAGDRSSIDAILRADKPVAGRRGADSSTPLMTAALYGDAALVTRLLAAGADPNIADRSGATALMWAAPDVATMTALLDAGADASACSEERRSALVVASAVVGGKPAVQLLLDYGASPFVQAGDPSPLREAARVGDADTFGLLLSYGVSPSSASAGGLNSRAVRTTCFKCARLAGMDADGPLPVLPPESEASATIPRYDPGRSARPTPLGATSATADALRAAVARSLPLLQAVDVSFVKQTGCVSCHHNSLVALAVSTARSHGVPVDESIAKSQSAAIGQYLEGWRERTLQNRFIAGASDTISYLLFDLSADHYKADAATDAQAIWLKRRQSADGHWALNTVRPPIESSEIEVTVVSMRALQAFAPAPRRKEFDEAVARARRWLIDTEAETTEEHAFRLLGLAWAKAPADTVADAARRLRALQRADGGWSQERSLSSDAYATGQALVALQESGAKPTEPALRRALEFLLRTQIEDGSWLVESRSVPIQAYFESGFPFGANQWISAAATAWATTALATALPPLR
jgi:hypothetical protein